MKQALIVGAGASGFLHALALRSAGVRITAVYDPDRERARWLAELAGGYATDTLDVDVDIAAVCSPPRYHVEQAIALARPERLVLVEKPVAVTEPDLERLAELPNIVPILQWRSGRTARQLRAAFEEELFGPRPLIHCECHLWRDADYFSSRTDWDCGALLSIGIHAIDLVLWMTGRRVVRSVRTESAGRVGVSVATRGELEIDFEGGAKARIRITLDVPGRNDVRLFVRGPHASMELLAGEADATATAAKWRGVVPREGGGAAGSPLLVPYVHDALAGHAPTIADVAKAHALAMRPSWDYLATG